MMRENRETGNKKKVARRGTKNQEENGEFRATFLENLLIKKKGLEELLERLMGSHREYDGQLTAGDFIDEFDDAQREISTHSLYSLIERKTRELKNIELLINRITREGKFGFCEECGRRIPKERLLIMPEATLCVPCQRELEKSNYRRSLLSSPSPTLGGKKGLQWDASDGLDDEGYEVKISPIDSFSLADIQETDPDDAFLEKE